jgi:hypothetical protein
MRFIIAITLAACSSAQPTTSLLQAAVACHQKGLQLADKEGSCQERLIRLDHLVQTDPDCQRIYRDAGTGLYCTETPGIDRDLQ